MYLRPGYLSYGAFGQVASHELTVGVGDSGVQYISYPWHRSMHLTLPGDFITSRVNLRNGGRMQLVMGSV